MNSARRETYMIETRKKTWHQHEFLGPSTTKSSLACSSVSTETEAEETEMSLLPAQELLLQSQVPGGSDQQLLVCREVGRLMPPLPNQQHSHI